ncbi:MAG: hypothetical protein R3324_08575, partial [Halobacteriales archaeon]|nr:hypothetical protein [Halobacteriales archaeon]
MCPRDGTPLFAAETGADAEDEPKKEKKKLHAVASLEEASDALKEWESEASDAEASDAEAQPDAEPDEVFEVVGGEDPEQYDPTQVMEVTDREEFKRRALEAAGVHVVDDEVEPAEADVLEPDEVELEIVDSEPELEPEPDVPAANDDLLQPPVEDADIDVESPGLQDESNPWEQPQPSGEPIDVGEHSFEAPRDSFLADDEPLPEPIRKHVSTDPNLPAAYGPGNRPEGAAHPSNAGPPGGRGPRANAPPPQGTQPPGQAPGGAAHPAASGPPTAGGPPGRRNPEDRPSGSMPAYQLPASSSGGFARPDDPPSEYTAEIKVDPPSKSSKGRTLLFIGLAVLLGAAIGAGAYFLELVPGALVDGASSDAEPV